jgi:Tol biopolymer transport system component
MSSSFSVQTGNAPPAPFLESLSVSPDGRWLAFAGPAPGVESSISVWVMPSSGGEIRNLCSYRTGAGWKPTVWSPDGKYVLFVVSGTEEKPTGSWQRAELMRVPFGGGEPQKTNLAMYGIYDLVLHPDGGQVAFRSSGPEVVLPETWVIENFLPRK